jgi:hypothetical protein
MKRSTTLAKRVLDKMEEISSDTACLLKMVITTEEHEY